MNALKERLDALQPRERYILLGGTAAAVLILVWAVLLVPLNDAAAELRAAVDGKARLLVDVRRVEGLQPAAAAPAASQALFVLVDTTRQPYGLQFPRTRPDGPNGITVTFQNASFDALLEWLIAIEAEHGVAVESASFSGSRERGLVSGQVVLRRG